MKWVGVKILRVERDWRRNVQGGKSLHTKEW